VPLGIQCYPSDLQSGTAYLGKHTQTIEIQLFDLFTQPLSLGVFPQGIYQLRVRFAGGAVSRAVVRG
jgi:hypothetical protein